MLGYRIIAYPLIFFSCRLDLGESFAPSQQFSSKIGPQTKLSALPAFFGSNTKGKTSPEALEAVEIYNNLYGESQYRRQEDSNLLLTFNELASIYGKENAIEMVKIQPLCLAFNRSYFAECFKTFSEKFGDEDAIGMVTRNPGLLGVSPTQALKTDDSAMTFSYIIAFTRPLGKAGLYVVFTLFFFPTLEVLTGIPVRQTVLSAISGN
eukprot:CAMPEP_0113300182 /NCGR_PEP_ID=MMETSP0010_2-20120614/1920_1 /TAXON_ID=216773 ORGANISM="Corethron hystrix, Strain 308" /NCGR_SAMPLE_ID=MMETSP0010_2 /ASSEMBLY_ACC=CAM_ASM_000155 /LENGTH=207 /DNA_ID=CAMNT_0000153567 /DNA_START=119 /DNA_END=742 /DNA_ORIENTATION=- /assembly_acc=CAM_ASM_000155